MHPLSPAYLAQPWSALGLPPNRTSNSDPTHLGAGSSVVRAAMRAGSLENWAGLEPTRPKDSRAIGRPTLTD